MAETNPYLQPDPVEEANPYLQPDPVAPSDHGYVGAAAAGVAGSLRSLNTMAGEGEQFVGRAANEAGFPGVGQGLIERGQNAVKETSDYDTANGNGLSAADEANPVKRNLYGIGQGVGQMAVVGGTAAAAAFAAAPAAGLAGLGWAIGNVAALPALMGLAQGETTAKSTEAADLKAGTDPELAKSHALQAGSLTAGATTAGAAALGMIGPVGKAVKIVGGAAENSVVRTALGLSAANVTTEAGQVAGKALLSDGTKNILKSVGTAAAEGGVINAATTAANQGIETAYGARDGVNLGDVGESAVQGAAIGSLMHAPHAVGKQIARTHEQSVLASADASIPDREKAAMGAMALISTRDPELAKAFGQYAQEQIKNGAPIELGQDSMYLAAGQQAARAAQDQAAGVADDSFRTTKNQNPAFVPTGDEAAGMAPASLYDPTKPDNTPVPAAPDAELNAPPFTQTFEERQAAGNTGNMANIIGPIFKAQTIDEMTHAFEQSVANGINKQRQGPMDRGTFENEGAITPNSFMKEKAYFDQKRAAAAEAERQQNLDTVQGIQRDQATPTTDPFALRDEQRQQLGETEREAAFKGMEQQALADAADRHTELSQWQAEHPGEATPDHLNPYLAPDPGEAPALERGQTPNTPEPVPENVAPAAPAPMAGPARAKPDSQLTPMEFAMRRSVQALGRKKLDYLTTEQLKSIADHHPDPLLSAKAQALFDARRNKGNVASAYPQEPSTLGENGVLTGNQSRLGPRATGEVGLEFSDKAENQPATGTEGDLSAAGRGKGIAKAPAGAKAVGKISLEQTDPALRRLKVAFEAREKRPFDLERVRADALPEKTGTVYDPRFGEQRIMSKGDFNNIDKMVDVFGKKAIGVTDNSRDLPFNGVMMPSDDRHVFINVKSQTSQLAVAGHELSHHMERDAPDLHRALAELIDKQLKTGALDAYTKKYRSLDTSTPDGRAYALNEVIADLVGNRATEFRTWQKIFAGADASQHGLVRRIADFISHFIDKILNNEKFKKFATDELVHDLGAVKDGVRHALAEWANREGRKGIQHDAEQLRAGKENRDAGTIGGAHIEPVEKVQPTHRINAEPRADIGRAPDTRAPAPVAERDPSTLQGSASREPIRKPGEREVVRDQAAVEHPAKDRTEPVDTVTESTDTVKTPAQKRADTLAAKDAEAQAAAEKAADISAKRAQAARNAKGLKDTDPLTVAVSKLGGIKSEDLRAIGLRDDSGAAGRDANYALGRRGGMQMDDMAQRLQEQGYLSPNAGESPRDALERELNAEVQPGGARPSMTEEGMRQMFDRYNAQGYEDYVKGTTPEERAQWDAPQMEQVPQHIADFIEHDAYTGLSREEADQFDREARRLADEGGFGDASVEEPDVPFDTHPSEGSHQGNAGDGFALTGESAAEGNARLTAEEQKAAADKQAASDAERKAAVDAEKGDFKLTGSNRPADANDGQNDLLLSRMRHPDLHEVQADIESRTETISPEDAHGMVDGMTEKVHGVDPATWINMVRPQDKLQYGDIPLEHFTANEGEHYDATVEPERAADYAKRPGNDAPPVIGILSTKSGKINILDGGHRLSAARARGDETIPAIVEIRSKTSDAATHAEKVATSAKADLFSADTEKRSKAEKSPALGKTTAEQDAALIRVGGIARRATIGDRLANGGYGLGWKTGQTMGERWNEFKNGFGMRLRQGIADQYAPIKALSMDAYEQIRLAKGTDGTLEAMLMFGKPVLDGGTYNVDAKGTGFAKTLSRLGGEHDRFFQWVAALRAEELMKPTAEFPKGREHLYSPDDIKILKTLGDDSPDNPHRAAKFEQAMKEYNAMNDAVLKIAEESGLLTPELREMFKDQPYVPFYRVMDGGDLAGPTKTSGLVNQYAFKKLKGGTQALNDDLLANVLQNWSHLLGASSKNRGSKLALEAAVEAGIAEKIPAKLAGKGTVRVLEGGDDVHYAIHDRALFDAVSAMSQQVPRWMAPISKFKRALTFGVTVSPGFKIRNLIRDSISSLAIGDMSKNVGKNLLQGYKATAHDSQTYASMLASGGIIRMGSMLDGNSAERTKRLIRENITTADRVLDSDSKLNAFRDEAVKRWKQYQEFGDRSENINRAALYEQLRAKGVSHTEASYQARDLMDFSMSGNWPVIRFLTQSVPFMNARIQGLYKLGSAASTPAGAKRLGIMAGAVSLASIVLWATQKDDPAWQKREDWDKENYWWFHVPGMGAFRIPKPFELGAIGSIAEHTAELMDSSNKDMNGKLYMQRVGALIGSQFSFNPTPQIVKPLVDVSANQDSFTGRPIETAAMQKQMAKDRYGPNTTVVGRMLGQLNLPNPLSFINGTYQRLSPVQYDELMKGYTGSLGTLVLTGVDMMAHPFMGEGQKPSQSIANMMSAGMFDDLSNTQSRYVSKMYDNATAVEQAYNSYHAALKAGNQAKARQEMADNRGLITSYTGVEQAKRTLSQISAQEKRIQSSTMLTGDAKRAALNKLNDRKNALAQRSVEHEEARGVQ